MTENARAKIEESKLTERLTLRTSELLNKGLELGNDMYAKTSDTLSSINVRGNIIHSF